MTIVAFVIDTNESMSAKTSNGCSLMDHAKDAVEQMTVKKRQTPSHFVLLTSCLLLTTEEWPGGVKTSWADWGDRPERRAARFQEQLKKLAPGGQNDVASALGKAFDMLGQHRFRTGVDTWGKGRSPWCTEPGAVVLITDGKNAFLDYSDDGSADASDFADDEGYEGKGGEDFGEGVGAGPARGGRSRRAPLSMDAVAMSAASSAVGSELCGKPFRWDQRLFTLLIGAGKGGTAGGGDGTSGFEEMALSALKGMCEETGGCMLRWDGGEPMQQPLASHVDALMRKLQKQGPVVMFRPEDPHDAAGEDSDDFDVFSHAAVHHDTPRPPVARGGLIVRGGSGVWPIPEPYWVDRQLEILPQREEAQPEIIFRRTDVGSADAAAATAEHLEQLGVSVDHYELEWCGKGARLDVSRSAVWPLFVRGSGPSPGQPEPFGYLRSSQTPGKTVMVVLPYNYPVLAPLLKQRANMVQANGTSAPPAAGSPWAREFIAYAKAVPSYYHPILFRVLQPFGVQGLIPGEGLPNGGGVLNRKVLERLHSLKELAGRQLERADRIERAGRAAQDLDQRQQSQSLDPSSLGGGGGGPAAAPSRRKPFAYSSVLQIPVGELLYRWEGMRSQLFGAGGVTVDGLFSSARSSPRRPRNHKAVSNPSEGPSSNAASYVSVTAGKNDTSGVANRNESSRSHDSLAANGSFGALLRRGGKGRSAGFWQWGQGSSSPVLGCVAECLAPALTTQDMSDYISRMHGIEFPRDPLGEPEPDENSAQGAINRLMASTTFESPWAKKKGGALGQLGLDEAANESAILTLNMNAEASASDGTDKDESKADEMEVDVESPSPDTPPTTTATSSPSSSGSESNGGQPSEGSPLPCATTSENGSKSGGDDGPGQGSANSGVAGGASGQAQNGGSSRASRGVSRRQLPKLVAKRGRRRMPQDSSIFPVEPAGPDLHPRTPLGAAPAFHKGMDASTGKGDLGGNDERILIPPASPALPVPRTPDHSPPPDSPLYLPGESSKAEEGARDERGLPSSSSSNAEGMAPAKREASGGLVPGRGSPGAKQANQDGGRRGEGISETDGGHVASYPRKSDEKATSESGETAERPGGSRDARIDRENGGDSGEQRPRPPPPRGPPPKPPLLDQKTPGKPRPPAPRPPPPRPPPPLSSSPLKTSPSSAPTAAAFTLTPSPATVSTPPPSKSGMYVRTDSPATFGVTSQAPGRGQSPASSLLFMKGGSPAKVGAATSTTPTPSPAQREASPAGRDRYPMHGHPQPSPTSAHAKYARTDSPARYAGAHAGRAGGEERMRDARAPNSGAGIDGAQRGTASIPRAGPGNVPRANGQGGAAGAGDGSVARKRPREDHHPLEMRRLGPYDYILPEGWIVGHSKKENREYYFNTVTKKSQWTPPEGSRPR